MERNALRAELVERAEQGRGSSLYLRGSGDARVTSLLHPWPLPRLGEWTELVNEAQTEAELAGVKRGSPYGTPQWQQQTARTIGLEATLRPLGRPKKKKQVAPQEQQG